MLILVILANILVFAIMAIATGRMGWPAETLFAWGGNLGAATLHGQSWRLFTATYLHAGVQHIIGNMALLAVAGLIAEVQIGSVAAMSTYTLTALAGGLLSAWLHPDVVSVGASGGIAGILGVIVALYACGRDEHVSGKWLLQVVAVNAVYSFAPDVDGLAHLGGFLTGLACGFVLAMADFRPVSS